MEMLEPFLQSSGSVSLLGVLVVLLVICVISSSSSFSSQTKGKEPPGPKALPLLGNLLQLDLKRPCNSLLKFSMNYGSVFRLYLGRKKVVVLAGYKTVKEALVNHAEEFGDRDSFRVMDELVHGHGVTWANGESWKVLRRFSITTLRDFGMGKKECENKIIEESQHLVEVFKNFKGEAFDTTKPLTYAISNVICTMIYGRRFEYEDPEFTSLVDCTGRNNQLLWSLPVQLYNLFPWIGKWFSGLKEFKKHFFANSNRNRKLFGDLKETLNPQMCRGFVDAFMVHKQNLEKSGITDSYFHNENLIVMVLNLFAAGTNTASATIKWGLMLMAKYPKIQDQVQEELSRIIGGRQVQLSDRMNLPVTNAVIHETQRLASIAPMALPHKTTRDITFQGYFLKKGTTVYPFLMSVLHDASEWARPDTFNPARFLDKDGKFITREAFMPFSAGHRVCLGESLARMELFIVFTTLLQHFQFSPPPGVSEDDLDLTPSAGFGRSPSKHKLCAVPRM